MVYSFDSCDFFHDNNLTLVYKLVDIKQKETVERERENCSKKLLLQKLLINLKMS